MTDTTVEVPVSSAKGAAPLLLWVRDWSDPEEVEEDCFEGMYLASGVWVDSTFKVIGPENTSEVTHWCPINRPGA